MVRKLGSAEVGSTAVAMRSLEEVAALGHRLDFAVAGDAEGAGLEEWA